MDLDHLHLPFILDTDVIRPIFEFYYPPELFPEIWAGIDGLLEKNLLYSVEDVKKECQSQLGNNPDALSWIDENSSIFLPPEAEDFIVQSEILSHSEFQMSKEEIEKGKTKADIYLVARGKCMNGCVVTNETYQPVGRKIPTICERYHVDCISRIDFIRILREKRYI